MNTIKVVQTVSTPIAAIRARVSSQELARFVPAACGEVWGYIHTAKLSQPGRQVAVYLGDGSVEVGAEIGGPFLGSDRVICSKLPGGKALSVTHYGPYGKLRDAYR